MYSQTLLEYHTRFSLFDHCQQCLSHHPDVASFVDGDLVSCEGTQPTSSDRAEPSSQTGHDIVPGFDDQRDGVDSPSPEVADCV